MFGICAKNLFTVAAFKEKSFFSVSNEVVARIYGLVLRVGKMNTRLWKVLNLLHTAVSTNMIVHNISINPEPRS